MTSRCLCLLLLMLVGTASGQTPEEVPVSRVLFGSCIQQGRPTPIFEAMLRADPQLLILLGDNIYADTADIGLMRAKYAVLAANPQFQALRAACPLLATWDDHDFGVNDGGDDYPKREESQDAFLDFLGESPDSPRRQRPGVYGSWMFGPEGKRLQVILLDVRYFRSPLKQGPRRVGGPYVPDEADEATLLGEAQWRWLEEQLRQPADLRLIGSGIQVLAEAAGQETWSNFPKEQERLFRLIESTEARGVMFLSGDRHWAEISAIEEGVPYRLIDVTSSSFNQKHPRGTPTANGRRLIPETYHEENFGYLEIDWETPAPTVLIQVRDLSGRPRLSSLKRGRG